MTHPRANIFINFSYGAFFVKRYIRGGGTFKISLISRRNFADAQFGGNTSPRADLEWEQRLQSLRNRRSKTRFPNGVHPRFRTISIFDGNHSTSRDTRCSSFKFPVLRPIMRETPTRGIDSHSNAFRSCEITSDVLRIFGFFDDRKVVMEIFVFDIKRYCTILRINYVKKSSTINATTIEITNL